MNKKDSGSWYFCESCGKRLIQRHSNGVFTFKFGRNSSGNDVVHIEIIGSIRIKCFREACQHMNVVTFFPTE